MVNNRQVRGGKYDRIDSCWTPLVILFVSFAFGAIFGFFFSALFAPDESLQEFLVEYLGFAAHGGLDFSLISVVYDCFRWPFLTAIMGLTVIGVLVIPCLFAFRGFLLAYSVSVFAAFFGMSGVAIAAIVFSVTMILMLPALFIVGCEALRSSCTQLPGGSALSQHKFRLDVAFVSLGLFCIASALQWTVLPVLFSVMSNRLLV